jgi:hypothetical protein
MDEKCEPKVDIAENGLSASLILPKDFDRSALAPAFCKSLLERSGIVADAIDQEKMIEFVTEAMAAEPGPFEAVIAEALPATHGTDAFVEWHVEEPQDAPQVPQDEIEQDTQDEPVKDGAVSFYSQSSFIVVKKGDVLGQVHPEVPGKEGKDVRGKVLAARTAKPLEFKFDESITIDERHNLVAQIDGVLMRDRLTAKVSDTLEVDQNVDFSTGNIDFPGNVLVHRGVKDCFTVQARDDIEVKGLIEAATIIAGHDLNAKGGFAGREQGTAHVGHNLNGKYLDAVDSNVAGDLFIEREVINCNTVVMGNIKCPHGSIIGGCTRVSGTVELMDLGASAQPDTELHVGVLPRLDPLIDELTAFVDELVEQRDQLLSEQEMITANSGARIAPSHQAKLDQITEKMGKLQLQLDRAEPSLEKIREHAESIRKIDVTILRKLHPKALIVSNGYYYQIKNEIKGPIRITCNHRGQLEYQFSDDRPQLLSSESDLRTAA